MEKTVERELKTIETIKYHLTNDEVEALRIVVGAMGSLSFFKETSPEVFKAWSLLDDELCKVSLNPPTFIIGKFFHSDNSDSPTIRFTIVPPELNSWVGRVKHDSHDG